MVYFYLLSLRMVFDAKYMFGKLFYNNSLIIHYLFILTYKTI